MADSERQRSWLVLTAAQRSQAQQTRLRGARRELPSYVHDDNWLNNEVELPVDPQSGASVTLVATDEQTTTRTDIDHGDIPGALEQPDSIEQLAELDLRAEETDNPFEAVQEGYTYVAPTDPPVVPGEQAHENAIIGSGLGASALDEAYDADHHSHFLSDDDEMTTRVREALRADSSTSAYASRLRIATRDGIVTVRGVVDDLLDSDNIIAVASVVEGITEVIDELRIRGIDER